MSVTGSISPIALGATLYVPCMRGDLFVAVIGARRPPGLRSAVLCLEDSVRECDLPTALAHLATFLRALATREPASTDPLLFVRPRSAAMLEHILCMPGIERIDGFVVPKAHADSMPAYLALPLHDRHRLMPTLETRETCDPQEMRRFRDQLLAVQDRILALRIGGNDLLQAMGLRRAAHRTAYEGPLGGVMAQLIAGFAPWGFALSAPVLERFADTALLREEVMRDIEHGLLTKTAIHPTQIPVIQTALAAPANEVEEARLMLAEGGPAVFGREGVMCEPATHRGWAERLLERAAFFGIADPVALRA
ncbi:HpcH/HpaI aldolase/citrate lyase family protein [Novosphingobium album (ex Liu et al. 2023)]|uniref:HpcH/HpaI aldolase/citrate lyase family protein n=1 Tax=Novosphingobium album (ex Liu et al. 2023) TaxID=3031130 RepID=A0ABT5WQM3_9SPHN|nr:HpcH/HpaI aldolase/citrate lyase family protein [Novosphingobium album (ex Liu et al. 2023)]MDE8652324.1 HpcH/HpaI aldolase/citrate lyase family protein [Novosphingobium album (ex Liu et al. 2023)]